jgi:putative endonuclease
MIHWVYILWSERLKRYYIGSTSDIQRRIKEHNAGKSGYTRRGIPWKLVYKEISSTKQSAWIREMEIKRYKSGMQFKKLIGGVA